MAESSKLLAARGLRKLTTTASSRKQTSVSGCDGATAGYTSPDISRDLP